MRLLSILFAFYFFVLAVKPCEDGHDITAGNQTVSIAAMGDCNDGPLSGEHCSPLCTCTCCSTVVLISHHAISPVILIQSACDYHYSETSHSEVAFSIWQPPKIS